MNDQSSFNDRIKWLTSEDGDESWYVGYKIAYPKKEDFKAAVEKESPDFIVPIDQIEDTKYRKKEVWAVHLDVLEEREVAP